MLAAEIVGMRRGLRVPTSWGGLNVASLAADLECRFGGVLGGEDRRDGGPWRGRLVGAVVAGHRFQKEERMRMARVVSGVLVTAAVWAGSSGTAWAGDLLPDLGMGRISTVKVDTTTMPGSKLLRYNSLLADVGAGPFEVSGSRSSTNDATMSATQDVYQSGGGYRAVATGDVIGYHNSAWRLQDLEAGWLQTVGGSHIAALAKHWYCAADDVHLRPGLARSPANAVYTGNCGYDQPNLLSMVMGVSVGWADNYTANTYQQWIDITGVPNGTYYLYAQADPDGYFTESNTSNNTTWDKIRIHNNAVKILQYGPHV
jgi:hypothetical protein